MSQFIAEALNLKKQEITSVQTDPLSLIRFHAPPRTPLLDLNLEPLPPDLILDLSYNQVNEVQSCPLRYKINHVLKIPARSAHYLVLGLALHKAIETLLMMKKDGRIPFWNEVEDSYDRAWISEGFLSREHEEQRKEEGRKSLQKFYERELEDPVIPFLIEEEFSFHHKQIRLRGRWDRVDFDGTRAIIIDYKSSDIQEQQKADQKVEETLQLYIYALAFHQRYGIWPEAMELRFIDSGLIGRVPFPQEELAKVMEKIESAADQIRKREFPPKPEYQNCRFCQVRQICSFSAY
jgi:DNA helicase II / ATP-dependent DNA helicase PcrA